MGQERRGDADLEQQLGDAVEARRRPARVAAELEELACSIGVVPGSLDGDVEGIHRALPVVDGLGGRDQRVAMASMGKPDTKVAELCKELGISRQTLYRHVSPNGEARPDSVRVLARK